MPILGVDDGINSVLHVFEEAPVRIHAILEEGLDTILFREAGLVRSLWLQVLGVATRRDGCCHARVEIGVVARRHILKYLGRARVDFPITFAFDRMGC